MPSVEDYIFEDNSTIESELIDSHVSLRTKT